MKAYEKHCAQNGKPPSVSLGTPVKPVADATISPLLFTSPTPILLFIVLPRPFLPRNVSSAPEQHARAKEIIAGLAAVEVDRLFETKGGSPHSTRSY